MLDTYIVKRSILLHEDHHVLDILNRACPDRAGPEEQGDTDSKHEGHPDNYDQNNYSALQN
jgi:hypothetical protein